MSTAAAVKRTAEQVLGKDKIISSDSHIMEPVDLWEANLTASLKAKFPKFPPRNTAGEKPGGHDPKARLDEMAVDGVSAEVLYATHGLRLYALEQLRNDVPRLKQVTVGKGRIVFSALDIRSGLLGTNTWGVLGYLPEYSEALMKNFVSIMSQRDAAR